MEIAQLLETLEAEGIHLSISGDHLACTAPKGGLRPELRSALSLHKGALLAHLQAANAAIPRLPADQPSPLSLAQQRLWLLDQLEGGSSRYNLVAASRISGPVDIAALEKTLRYLVDRHAILRTRFFMAAGEPQQQAVVVDDASALQFTDLGALSAAQQESALHAALGDECQHIFDLARPPLMRTHLLRLGATAHVLISNQHHIVSDGWSRGIFARELLQAYSAFAAGRPPAIASLPIQYADFAAWQKNTLADQLDGEIDFWRQELADSPALLPLPTDFPRPAQQTYRGAALPVRIDPALTGALHELARQHDISLFMLLQAVLYLCLQRHSGAHDIAIGVPVAGRSHPATENLIGCFVNSLVMRCRLEDNWTFPQLLGAVRALTLRALAHQTAPFEKVVEALQVPRDLSYSPLFQVMFSFLNQETASRQVGVLHIKELAAPAQQVLFDLDWQLREVDGAIDGSLTYASDLFTAEHAAGMIGNFRQALQAVVANPAQRLAEIDLLPSDERQRLLEAWLPVSTAFPRNRRVQELFAEQAARTPEAIAVSGDGEHWSYRQLEQQANGLAQALQQQGIATGALIGLCVGRSPRTLAALLGILKAGAAYLPLDPGFPAERLAYMLEDSSAALVLSETGIDATLRARLAAVAPLLLLDELPAPGTASAPSLPPVQADELMYVIYTSGSTGQPKGVMLTHASVVNFLVSMAREPGIQATDSLLAVTTLSFDIAVLELFLPLLNGARVVLAEQAVSADPQQLLQRINAENITLMQATPATWRLLLAAGWAGKADLTILCGGEALPCDLSQLLSARCRALWNMYGPTETTVWSAIRRIAPKPAESQSHGCEPIGRAIANTRLYILDPQQRLLPTGAIGELWIGGDGLALGYHGQPALTAERFVRDPFVSTPAARMYRTGDQSRWRGDGSIEFLGRLDHQVKLRGYRIELGEIESILGQHPAVAHCAVVIREDSPGEARLLAYLVASTSENTSKAPPDSSSLRHYLRTRLPEYMLPASFILLPTMPLTPNGKVDRQRLPAPQTTTSPAPCPPGNALEQQIAALWEKTLKIPTADVNANFFDLGGHSLLLIRLHQSLRETFGIDLAVLDLFRHATIRRQATLISGNQPSTAPENSVRLHAERQRQAFQRQRAAQQARQNK